MAEVSDKIRCVVVFSPGHSLRSMDSDATAVIQTVIESLP